MRGSCALLRLDTTGYGATARCGHPRTISTTSSSPSSSSSARVWIGRCAMLGPGSTSARHFSHRAALFTGGGGNGNQIVNGVRRLFSAASSSSFTTGDESSQHQDADREDVAEKVVEEGLENDPRYVLIRRERLEELLEAEILQFGSSTPTPLTLPQIYNLNLEAQLQTTASDGKNSALSENDPQRLAKHVGSGTSAPYHAGTASSGSAKAVASSSTSLPAGAPSTSPITDPSAHQDSSTSDPRRAFVRSTSTNLHTQHSIRLLENFLKRELPIRYASRIKLIEDSLPGWQLQKNLRHVRKTYADSFKRMRIAFTEQESYLNSSRAGEGAGEQDLGDFIEDMKLRHANTIPHIMSGVADMFDKNVLDWRKVDSFMSAFFASRIGTESLTNHYLAIRKHGEGIIKFAVDPVAILKEAAEEATELCRIAYGGGVEGEFKPPEIQIRCASTAAVASTVLSRSASTDRAGGAGTHSRNAERKTPSPAGGTSANKSSAAPSASPATTTIASVPEYLHYVSFEILKNSLRAVVEHHMLSTSTSTEKLNLKKLQQTAAFPPIRVDVSCANATLTVRVSDEGGGISRTQLRKIWSYLYTTAKPITEFGFGVEDEDQSRVPMAGFGCGLPLTQAYLHWVGGSVDLVSLPTFGTDVYIKINGLL